MQTHTRAGIIVMVGVLALGGGYITVDGANVVPGIPTSKPPLPRVATFPTPKAASPILNQASLFDISTAPGPALFKNLTREFITDYRMKDMKVSWWIGILGRVELASINPDLALVPASTTKLFTVAATLCDFGSTGRVRAVVAWDELARKLYLIGGGDILLGTGADTSEDIPGYAGLGTLAADIV